MRAIEWIGMGSIAVLTACAPEVPTERLQSSAAAIRAAEEVGAADVPQAALHLQLAKEQSERAKKLIADGKREEATFTLMRAEADANLALALKRTTDEQVAANAASYKLQKLQTQPTP